MDLGAYEKIELYKDLAKQNGIEIPRLRGYRLMEEEKPFSKADIDKWKKECEVSVAEDLCCARPFWKANARSLEFSSYTDINLEYFLFENPNKDEIGYQKYVGIRWDRIHGWKRKELKFAIKKQKKKIQKQYDAWNKYAGKKDVLYIHSRMGGYNWIDYSEKEKITQALWFLERVDDAYDCTYCDFYAKIEKK